MSAGAGDCGVGDEGGVPRTRSMRAPLNMVAPALAPELRSEAVLDGCVRASYLTSRDPVLHWGADAPPRIFLIVKKWNEPSSREVSLALGRWLAGLGRTVLAGADAGDGCPLPFPEFARLGSQPDGSVLTQADVDMAIVVGGDGSVMHASALFGQACPPVLALSVGGTLGFLTAHTLASARALLSRVMHLHPEAAQQQGGSAGAPPASQPCSSRTSASSATAAALAGEGAAEAAEAGPAGELPPSPLPPSPQPPSPPPLPHLQLQLPALWGSGGEEEQLPHPPRAPGTAGVSMRMRLQVEVYRGGAEGGAAAAPAASSPRAPQSTHVVLNELHLGRGSSPIMTRINAYVDDEPLTTVLSDGLIISTQTGSTAYALSAGGSILSPSTRGIMFCPICPHTLSFRPLVLSDAALIRLEIDEASRGTCLASFDGRPDSVALGKGDYVLIRASPWPLPLLVHRGPTTDWLLGLHQKLLWNVRGDGGRRIPAPRSVRSGRSGGAGWADTARSATDASSAGAGPGSALVGLAVGMAGGGVAVIRVVYI